MDLRLSWKSLKSLAEAEYFINISVSIDAETAPDYIKKLA